MPERILKKGRHKARRMKTSSGKVAWKGKMTGGRGKTALGGGKGLHDADQSGKKTGTGMRQREMHSGAILNMQSFHRIDTKQRIYIGRKIGNCLLPR